jgi:hypothetical protein
VLQASTSEVYGDPEIHPQPESYRGSVNPIGIRACYDEGKRAAETLFMDYYRMNKVNVRIVRIFNTYGPRMHPFDGRVVSNFIRQALNGEDITIFGDGSQTRSFCYRDDLIEGMIRMMNGPDDFVGPVNIGNPGEYSIRQLAEMTIKITGSKSKLVERPLPSDDPTRRQPVIDLAQSKLGWEPKVFLRNAVRATNDSRQNRLHDREDCDSNGGTYSVRRRIKGAWESPRHEALRPLINHAVDDEQAKQSDSPFAVHPKLAACGHQYQECQSSVGSEVQKFVDRVKLRWDMLSGQMGRNNQCQPIEGDNDCEQPIG